MALGSWLKACTTVVRDSGVSYLRYLRFPELWVAAAALPMKYLSATRLNPMLLGQVPGLPSISTLGTSKGWLWRWTQSEIDAWFEYLWILSTRFGNPNQLWKKHFRRTWKFAQGHHPFSKRWRFAMKKAMALVSFVGHNSGMAISFFGKFSCSMLFPSVSPTNFFHQPWINHRSANFGKMNHH